jgi:hypothetical protein
VTAAVRGAIAAMLATSVLRIRVPPERPQPVSVIVNSRTRRELSGGGCLGENTQCTNSMRVESENFPHNGHSACTHSFAQWRARSELILAQPCRRPWRAASARAVDASPGHSFTKPAPPRDARSPPPHSVRGRKHHRCDFTKCAKAFSVVSETWCSMPSASASADSVGTPSAHRTSTTSRWRMRTRSASASPFSVRNTPR